jgi:hypothetical protein
MNAPAWMDKFIFKRDDDGNIIYVEEIAMSRAIGHNADLVIPTPDITAVQLQYPGVAVMATDGLWDAMTPEDARDFVETNIDLALYKALDLFHKPNESQEMPLKLGDLISGTIHDASYSPNSSQKEPFTIAELASLTYTILALMLTEKASLKSTDNISVTIVDLGLFEAVVEKLAWFTTVWYATPETEMEAYRKKKEAFDEVCTRLDFAKIMRLAKGQSIQAEEAAVAV